MKKISQNNQNTLKELQDLLGKAKGENLNNIQIPPEIQNGDPQLKMQYLLDLGVSSEDAKKYFENVDKIVDKQIMTEQQMEVQRQRTQQETMSTPAKAASKKVFNLKKAQQQNSLKGQIFENVEDFVTRYLEETKEINARNEVLDVTSTAGDEKVVGHISKYYKITGDNPEMTLIDKSKLANPIYEHLPAEMRKDNSGSGVIENVKYTHPKNENVVAFVKDVNEQIKKMAEKDVKKTTSPYNLKKQAQAKTTENIIMYGPSEKRFDPFLRQPVSDWHIVERNKGYGLVVDDIWNIDWEALWRGNIMDKYSRPYRDTKTGEWIGGYIQKRFEVDKWIPEGNNYQLKPGQLRKEYDPKNGNMEARLEAMRKDEASDRGYEPVSSGDPADALKIEDEYAQTKVANSNSKVFNLKKASCQSCSSKKKS